MTKKFWLSKTFWVNALAGLFGLLQTTGTVGSPIEPQEQLALLAVVNLILRLVTKGAVTLT